LKMQRRNFLRGLLGLAAVPVLEPVAKLLPAPPEVKPIKAVIGEYADYTSFSDISLQVYYDKKFIQNLKAMTPFTASFNNQLPFNSGNTISFYNYNLEANNDTADKVQDM